jgi:hypothetical protein
MGVDIITTGTDVSWSDNLLYALDRIEEPYVALNIDDLILCESVDHDAVVAVVADFVRTKGNYLRLNPTPPGRGWGTVGEVPRGDLYRASTIFSLWRKEILQHVLRRGESAWHFEIYGSARTDAFDKWFASRHTLIKHVNLVLKGKVDPRALAILLRCGIDYDSNRASLSQREVFTRRVMELRSQALLLLPRRLARSIRNVFPPT